LANTEYSETYFSLLDVESCLSSRIGPHFQQGKRNCRGSNAIENGQSLSTFLTELFLMLTNGFDPKGFS
jgi:hypothetical protein